MKGCMGVYIIRYFPPHLVALPGGVRADLLAAVVEVADDGALPTVRARSATRKR